MINKKLLGIAVASVLMQQLSTPTIELEIEGDQHKKTKGEKKRSRAERRRRGLK